MAAARRSRPSKRSLLHATVASKPNHAQHVCTCCISSALRQRPVHVANTGDQRSSLAVRRMAC
eukprot:352129-Chlamydomonas_euryale.AAC.6